MLNLGIQTKTNYYIIIITLSYFDFFTAVIIPSSNKKFEGNIINIQSVKSSQENIASIKAQK